MATETTAESAQRDALAAHINELLERWEFAAIRSPSETSLFDHPVLHRIIGMAEAAQMLSPDDNPVLEILLDAVRYHTCIHWMLSYLTCDAPPISVTDEADHRGGQAKVAQWWQDYSKRSDCRVRSITPPPINPQPPSTKD